MTNRTELNALADRVEGWKPYVCFCGAGSKRGQKHSSYCVAYYKPHYFAEETTSLRAMAMEG